MIRDAPKEWSDEVSSLYNPIRPLGQGGFGSVWLAKAKEDDTDENVAIKVVGHPLNQCKKTSHTIQRIEEGTFQREIAVLSEMNHPHIVKFLKFYRVSLHSPSSSAKSVTNQGCAPYCMILSYHKGPTLEMLLEHGGALGLPLAKIVSRQLIDAVSYLHDHSVIHRDIKPDNIIVSGASLQMDECWSDILQTEEEMEKMNKWSITLIDFGFAKKLPILSTGDDDRPSTTTKSPKPSSSMKKKANAKSDQRRGRSTTPKTTSLDQSISRIKIRSLSAVGNRNYAAPEIFKTIRRYHSNRSDTDSSTSSSKENDNDPNVLPLAEYVSDYGMVADAFSVGMTLRYVLTGVPPSERSIEDFIAMHNHPLLSMSRNFKKLSAFSKKSKNKVKRSKQFRSSEELSSDAKDLICGLTHGKDQNRATVRSVKNHAWIVN